MTHSLPLVAQMVKRLPAMQETWVWSLGWEDPLEKEMATHSSSLAWKIPQTGSLVGYSPWGRKESDRTEWLHFLFFYRSLGSLSSCLHLIPEKSLSMSLGRTMRPTAIAHRETAGLPSVLGNSFIEIRPHPSIYKQSTAGFLIQWQSSRDRLPSLK